MFLRSSLVTHVVRRPSVVRSLACICRRQSFSSIATPRREETGVKKSWREVMWPDKVPLDPEVNAKVYDSNAEEYRHKILNLGWEESYNVLKVQLDRIFQYPSWLTSREKITVLDAGCGDGILPDMYDFPKNVELHGCDISKLMMEVAEKKSKYQSLKEVDLSQEVSAYSDLPQFDLICSMGVLTYISTNNPIKEFVRLAKPGGIIIIAFRHNDYLTRGYPEFFEEQSNNLIVHSTQTYDPFPKDDDFTHDYIMVVLQKK